MDGISLKQALKLTDTLGRDGEVVWLQRGEDALAKKEPITVAEIKKRMDMRNTMVKGIRAHFITYEYEGWLFILG